MYKTLILLPLVGLTLMGCKETPRTAPHQAKSDQANEPNETTHGEKEDLTDQKTSIDPTASLLAVEISTQPYNRTRPWEKLPVGSSRIMGTYLGDGLVLTYGGSLESAVYVELSLPDGSRSVPARIIKYDNGLKLGLLSVKHEKDADIFSSRIAYPLGSALERGDTAELWCTLRGSEPLRVPLQVQSGEEDQGLPRLSMRADQTVPSGFALGAPVMKNGQLSGLSAGYDNQSRRLLAVNAELLKRFLADKEHVSDIPVLGTSHTPLTDPVFRRYLKLTDDQTGVYIGTVLPNSAAEVAGIKEGDVLTAIEGLPIDNQGRCNLPIYGQTSLSAAMRYLKPIGDKLKLSLNRGGEEISVEAPLNRDAIEKALIPDEKPGEAPRYVIWGGMVFQPLTSTYLETLKSQAKNTLPLEFLELDNRKEEFSKRGYQGLTALTIVIPTPATHGYDSLRFCVVEKVNGQEVHSFDDFIRLLDEPTQDGIVSFSINKPPFTIYVDRATAEACNDALRRSTIPNLRSSK